MMKGQKSSSQLRDSVTPLTSFPIGIEEDVINPPIQIAQSEEIQPISCGVEYHFVSDLIQVFELTRVDGFDFLCVPLVHPRYERDLIGFGTESEENPSDNEPFTRSDMLLTSSQWNSIIGKLSNWLDLDSSNERIRRLSEKVFLQEMSWATHLALGATLLPTPSYNCTNFANALSAILTTAHFCNCWIRIPLYFKNKTDDELKIEDDPWETWNRLRVLCEHHISLGVALEITEDLPPNGVIDRWLGEPVRCLILPTSLFFNQ